MYILFTASFITDIIDDIKLRYADLVVEQARCEDNVFIVVRQKALSTKSNVGPIYNPRIVILYDGATEPKLEFQGFFKAIVKMQAAADQYLSSLLPGSGYTVCSGIPAIPEEVRFSPKKYRAWTSPFVRHDSHNCKLWMVPTHHRRAPDDPLYNSCSSCRLLWHDVGVLVRRSRKISPSNKAKRRLPSSKTKMMYLSPGSFTQRPRNSRVERKAMMKSLKHYQKYDITLHNGELLQIVSSISDVGRNELERILKEADEKGKGDLLRKVWKLDVEDRMKYFKDQKKNGWFTVAHTHVHVH